VWARQTAGRHPGRIVRGRWEEIVRGPFGGSSWKGPPVPPHLMVLTLEFMGQVIPLNFHRFERLLIPAAIRCSSFTISTLFSS